MLGGSALALVVIAVILVLVWPKSKKDAGTGGGSVGKAAAKPASGPSVPRGPDLIINGSFEDGPEPDPDGPGFTVLETGSTTITGWTVTQGSVDYIGPYWRHADGRRSVDLNGNMPGAVSQSLRTRPGRKYTVTFRMAGNCFPGDGPTTRALSVSAAGQRGEFTFDTGGRTYEDMGWVTRSWEFTAVDEDTTLEFASRTDALPSCGPALDRVSVVETGG